MPVTRRKDEEGFTMIVTVIGMSLLALLVLVAVSSVNGDAHLTTRDLTRKQAYEAAKAGIDEYAFQLHRNSAYWSTCTTAGRRPLPGMPSAEYAVELIPVEPYEACDPTNLVTAKATMLEPQDPLKGTFRIRSNGYAGDSHVAITATFKPASFLDYVYFTQYETADPKSYATEELKYGAERQCETFIRDGRTLTALRNKQNQVMNTRGGVYRGRSNENEQYCETISFVHNDDIKGPMHTNDSFVICGDPTLGRGPMDPVEVGNEEEPGWYSTSDDLLHARSDCDGYPDGTANLKGTLRLGVGAIVPPKTNSELEAIAEPGYSFAGEVSICFGDSSITVGKGRSCSEQTLPYPGNGVIYVANVSCDGSYSPYLLAYPTTPSSCGNVNVSGKYSQPLTIAAANDVIVTGDVTKANENAMLGLIANNFIRIYHPVKLHPEVCGLKLRGLSLVWVCEEDLSKTECLGNAAGSISDPEIEAALLAINHSFIVDNFDCGSQLGDLTVKGAIAQKFRGAVGTTNHSGYLKDYEYDERLQTTEPPSFIQPIEADWVIGRETTE